MDYDKIHAVMGYLWSPLAAVSASWQGKDNAQIAVAIAAASIVPDRPRLIVQLYKTNLTHDLVVKSKSFAVNFLRKDQVELVHELGFSSGRDRDKLASIPYRAGPTRSPILKECLAYMDCRVVNAMDGGDMTAFLGEVVDGDTLSEAEPLFWHHLRTVMPQAWVQEWDTKIKREIEISRERMGKIRWGA